MVTTSGSRTARPDWAELSHTFQLAVEQGALDTFRRRRWKYLEKDSGRLGQDAVASLSQSQADALYRGAGGRHIAKFRTNPIEDIRDAVDFLLYDTIKLENRFEECSVETGGFGLAGAGREWPSYLLTLREPTLFAPWSPHTERALRRFGMLPAGLKNGHPGLCYIDLLDTMAALRAWLRLPDFRAVDEFCYLNGRTRRASD